MSIECKNVTKKIKGQSVINQFSWDITEPGIYAVLGPNGAGKTTMLQMIAGLTLADEGTLSVHGERPFDNKKIMANICFIQESDNFKPTLTVHEVLHIVQPFYENWNHNVADKLLYSFNLPKKRRLNALSKGMASALNMIVGIASRAPLTIFDEPYIGMDASARKLIYQELLADYLEYPRIILFSTHFIDETERLFESLCIMYKGQNWFEEDVSSLSSRVKRISGAEEEVDTFLTRGSVLHSSEFMGKTIKVVLFPKREEPELSQKVQMESVSLQDFFVYYTDYLKKERGGIHEHPSIHSSSPT